MVAALLLAAGVQARNEYAEIAHLRSMNRRVAGIRSMADGEHYTVLEQDRIVRYAYASQNEGRSLLPGWSR